MFDRLQERLKSKGLCPVCIMPQKVSIRLADGSISTWSCGTVQLDVAKDKDKGEPHKIMFFDLSGPNNLLGKYAFQQLWPSQYSALVKLQS